MVFSKSDKCDVNKSTKKIKVRQMYKSALIIGEKLDFTIANYENQNAASVILCILVK
jgi:hypothetical protein